MRVVAVVGMAMPAVERAGWTPCLVPILLAWRRLLQRRDQRAARLGRPPEEQLAAVRGLGAARLLVRMRAQRQRSVGARDACAVDGGDAEDGAPVESKTQACERHVICLDALDSTTLWCVCGLSLTRSLLVRVRALCGARVLDHEAQVQEAVRRDEQHDVPRQAQR